MKIQSKPSLLSADVVGVHAGEERGPAGRAHLHMAHVSHVSASTRHLLHVVLLQRDAVPRHAGQPPRHVRHPRVVPAHVAVAEVVREDEHDVGPRLLGRAGCSYSSKIWMDTQPADEKYLFLFHLSLFPFPNFSQFCTSLLTRRISLLKCSGAKSLLFIDISGKKGIKDEIFDRCPHISEKNYLWFG